MRTGSIDERVFCVKKWMVALCLCALLLAAVCCAQAAGSVGDYDVKVVANCWTASRGFGSTLYVPYLKVNVTNRMATASGRIVVNVVFYNEAERSVWSDETSYLVSGSDDPLKPGYNKTAFVTSSVGYRSQVSTSQLPGVTAEIYVNDVLYGSVSVEKTYSERSVSIALDGKTAAKGASDFRFATDDPFGVVVEAAYWGTNTGYTGQTLYVPYLKIRVTNQNSGPATRIVVKAVFNNDSDKSVLDDATSYLVSSSDRPLKTGYNKTAFIRADVGYRSQISVSYLPDISADIYVNDEYYGKVNIRKSYTESTLNTALKRQKNASAESDVPVDKENPYKVTLTANCWTANAGLGGQTLYVPYLKINVLNRSGKQVSSMKVAVVFYDESEKIVWSDESTYLVSSSSAPLQHGFSKTAFIKSSVGYRSKVSETSLPNVTAEIYLDGTLVGNVTVARTYSETALSTPVTKTAKAAAGTAAAAGSDPYDVVITANCWAANTGTTTLYTPYLKVKVVNQQGKPATNVKVHVVFYNASEKSLWSDETSYLVSSGDTPLNTGYGKIAFVRSSVGYRSKPGVSQLPNITAEVYVNDQLYGEIAVTRTFDETRVSQRLTKSGGRDDGAVQAAADGRDYKVSYQSNGWTTSTGLTGKTLYVPSLKVVVTNQKSTPAQRIVVHVVFYQNSTRTVWSDETSYLVSTGDSALRTGYNKTAFIYSSVGYTGRPTASQLPDITAEIYINDELYDTVTINKTVMD